MTAASPGGATVNHIVNHRAQVELFAIELVEDSRQIFRFHQLKLMTNRRDDALVTFASLFDEVAVAVFDLLFDDSTPTQTMIGELAVPLIVIECDFASFQFL